MGDRICSVEDCERQARTRGMCTKHYQTWRRLNPEEMGKVDRRKEPVTCSAPDCERRSSALSYCSMHYLRIRRTGSIEDPPRAQPRPTEPDLKWQCQVDGCLARRHGKLWCGVHDRRARRHGGDPEVRLRGEVVDGKRVCPRCGIDTPLADIPRVYCFTCEPQQQLEYLARKPRPKVDTSPTQCVICGGHFEAHGVRRFTCSIECTNARNNKENWRNVQKRRALLKNVLVETFSAREIYERDDWTCQLCGIHLDKRLKPPDPQSPSIDHIMPIARGGVHSRANVQAACRLCNMRKGARIPSLQTDAVQVGGIPADPQHAGDVAS